MTPIRVHSAMRITPITTASIMGGSFLLEVASA